MKKTFFFYTIILLFPFFNLRKAAAQPGRERHRSVTINQVIVDGKVLQADTIITYSDTITRTVNTKEIGMELPYTSGSTVFIDNSYRKLNIRRTTGNKVLLKTTIFYYGNPAFSDGQWFEKLNIRGQRTDSGTTIVSGGISNRTTSSSWSNSSESTILLDNMPRLPSAPTAPSGSATSKNDNTRITINGRVYGTGNISNSTRWYDSATGVVNSSALHLPANGAVYSTVVFDENGNVSYNSSSLQRVLTVYLPAGAKLNVISKYADVSIEDDVNRLQATINNASLEMAGAQEALISSSYGNIKTGDIDRATISLQNGRLNMQHVTDLQLNSRYSKMEAAYCGNLKIRSISDNFDIDEVQHLSGSKSYGDLRIDRLTGSFDLNGSSADIRIRDIATSVAAIRIDNKYADLQLPVQTLQNYEVAFTGNYTTIFAPFQKKDIVVENTTRESKIDSTRNGSTTTITTSRSSSTTTSRFNTGSNQQSFTVAVGNISQMPHTRFRLLCNNCYVDFK